MRVFGWVAGSDGTAHYRMVLPLVTMGETSGVPVSLSERMPDAVRRGDGVIVGQRLIKPAPARLWHYLAAKGQHTLVAEHDDDLFSIRDDHPMWSDPASNWPDRDTWRCEWMPAMRSAISDADLVTTTTEHLATQLREYSDNVTVLPNYIDAALLSTDQSARAPGEHIRVGWAGSATHAIDWEQNAPAIVHGLRKTDADLVLIGSNYGALTKYKRTTFRPWQADPNAYAGNLTDLHIGLAPLADDQFNRSKSYVKALEYAAAGIPTIASDVGPYPDIIEHGVTGFLVHHPHEWAAYIRLLANDEDLRQQMGAAARSLAAQHTIQEHAWRWREAYEKART